MPLSKFYTLSLLVTRKHNLAVLHPSLSWLTTGAVNARQGWSLGSTNSRMWDTAAVAAEMLDSENRHRSRSPTSREVRSFRRLPHVRRSYSFADTSPGCRSGRRRARVSLVCGHRLRYILVHSRCARTHLLGLRVS